MKRTLITIALLAAFAANAGGHAPIGPTYGNATSTANGGAAFGGQANTSGGNISSSLGGSAAANNIGGSATGNQGSVNGNSQVLTGNSASVSAGSANVTGGAMTNNLDGSVKGGAATTTSGAASTTSGPATTTGGNIASGINGSAKQSQSTASGVSGSGNSQGNATSVTVEGSTYEAQARNPVASAWAAPLTSANGTCMGSSSGGAQGAALGISFGTTWTDDGCDARYDAIALSQIGETTAARARLCLKPEIAKAFEAAGKPCPSAEAKRAQAVLEDRPVAAYADPYVAARLAMQGK